MLKRFYIYSAGIESKKNIIPGNPLQKFYAGGGRFPELCGG
jgi:hypothetical protein